MSTEEDKFKHSKRLLKDDNAIKKQTKIAKHHALDCGNPECFLCGNPRKTHKDKLTQQEKRLFQDTETVRDKRSNGLTPDDQSKL